MSCPKCQSNNVVEATAGTYRCNECDYAWVPYNTPARLPGTGQPVAGGSSAGLTVLLLLVILTTVALGFVSLLIGLLIGVFGLLAGILYHVSRSAPK